MMLTLIEPLRGNVVGGLNLLEWGGLGMMAVVAAWSVLSLRDLLTFRKNRPDKPKKRSEKPGKISNDDLKSLPKGEETVLVVDDDPAVLKANGKLISRLGYSVQRALGGQEAIDYIRNSHADLIVLDLLMPGLDGIETFREIKRINPHQKAIVLSGFAGPAMVSSIKTLGIHTYLVKPAESGILAKAIRDEIARA
jgi:CheY-like chemotaxis protein